MHLRVVKGIEHRDGKMTAISFPSTSKTDEMHSRSIESVLRFLDRKEYANLPGYSLLTVKPGIMRYITAHLFDRRRDSARAPVASGVTREEFDLALATISQKVEQRKDDLAKIAKAKQEIEEAVRPGCPGEAYFQSKEVAGLEKHGEVDMVQDIAELCNINFPSDVDSATARKELVTRLMSPNELSNIFLSLRRYLSEVIKRNLSEAASGADVEDAPVEQDDIATLEAKIKDAMDWVNFWKEAIGLSEHDFYDYIKDLGGEDVVYNEDNTVDPVYHLNYHKDIVKDLREQLEAAKAVESAPVEESTPEPPRAGVGELLLTAAQAVAVQMDGDAGHELEQKINEIARIHEDDLNAQVVINKVTTLMSLLSVEQKSSFLEFLAEPLGPFYSALVPFYRNISFLCQAFDKDADKILLIDEYQRSNVRQGVPKFAEIIEMFAEEKRLEKMGISFFGELIPFHIDPPDLSKTVYIPFAESEDPSPADIQILNEVNNMIVRDVTVVESGVVTERSAYTGRIFGGQTSKRVARELRMVGFLYDPQFFIAVEPIGRVIRGQRYEGAEGSLPSLNESVVDYLDHTTAVRGRRRGHVFCIFYHERQPYAADANRIYKLDRVLRSDALDPYTQEALLYAWDLSKVNLAKGRKESGGIYLKSTHSIYTYLVVSVRRPDDLYYRSIGAVPYDVLILFSNIFPELQFSDELMHLPETKKDKDYSGNFVDGGLTVVYNDLLWMQRFQPRWKRNYVMGEKAVEVFGETKRCDIVYCSPDIFDIEVLVGPSLCVHEVAARLQSLSRSPVAHRQYTLQPRHNLTTIGNTLRESIANPLFAHYLWGQPSSKFGELEGNLVRQALHGIAYTLYCKLRGGFCEPGNQLQDLTAVINAPTKTFRRYQFTRSVLKMVASETKGSLKTVRRGDISIVCDIIDIKGKIIELHPRVREIRRMLSTTNNPENIKSYYTYLANFTKQLLTFEFSDVALSDEEFATRKAVIDRIVVPETLRAQVIGRVLKRNVSTDLNPEEVISFKRLYEAERSQPNRQPSVTTPNVLTSYGLEAKIVSKEESEGKTVSELVVNDLFAQEGKNSVRHYQLPLTEEAEMLEQSEQIVEKAIDEPFMGDLNMTFLTLLDFALYQGKSTLLKGLYVLYHEYTDDPDTTDSNSLFARYRRGRGMGFYHDRLGAFLWDELVNVKLDDATKRRVYFLISWQAKNLVLQSTERVVFKEQHLRAQKPIIIYRSEAELQLIPKAV